MDIMKLVNRKSRWKPKWEDVRRVMSKNLDQDQGLPKTLPTGEYGETSTKTSVVCSFMLQWAKEDSQLVVAAAHRHQNWS